ncbi:phage portal protein [Streptomyces sp. NPDC050428]|uniref:phage portal protein n=1 Tax=Streptomyces sp. NPDC050428 TaxID=3155757 RepID=UPI003445D956
MPLPESNIAWPPEQFAPLFREICTDDAWCSGDRERLAKLYSNAPRRLDGQRRLWARRPAEPGRPDPRLHVPLAADIATTSADLLFSEPPTFTVEDTAMQAHVDELVDAGGIGNTLLEAAEVAVALGGVFLRVTWDRSIADRPLLTTVHTDAAASEFRFGHLVAVTFWRELPGSDTATVWRHLERHEPGAIVHGLYQGDRDRIGVRVPLTEHPDTAPLVEALNAGGDTVPTGLPDALTAAYVPNMGPNRRHRGAPWGRSGPRSRSSARRCKP